MSEQIQNPPNEVESDRIETAEDGSRKAIFGDPKAGPGAVEPTAPVQGPSEPAPTEQPTDTDTTGQSTSGQGFDKNGQPIEKPEGTAPEVETPPAKETGGFQKKATAPAAEEKQPEWFDSFKKDLGMEFDSVKALKEKLNQQPEQIEADFSDDYIRNATAYYNEHGTLQPFTEAFSMDFNEFTPQDIMRYELEERYPSLSDAAIDQLYQKEVIDKYNLDEDENDEAAVALGKELLEADAEKHRANFVEQQQAFIPPKKEDVQAQMELKQNEWRDSVTSNPVMKELLNESAISVNISGEDYTFGIDNPQEIMDMAIDNRQFWNLFAGPDGNVDMSAFAEVAAFARDRETYRQALMGLGKTSGVSEVKNHVKNGESPSMGTTKTPTYTDWNEGFLNAALAQKKKF